MSTTYTSESQVETAYQTLRDTFRSGRTRELAWRKWQLKQLWWLLEDNEQRIIDALHHDLHRHPFESVLSELRGIKMDLLDHVQNIEKWTADQVPDCPLPMKWLLRPTIRYEPLGVALIIGPWNYPTSLIFQPLIAAITAGCAVMLKPSEITVATQDLMVELIPKYMDSSAIQVVTGGAAETGSLLARKFDHIFFTGSVNVARHVAAAAAKNLTPTTLELGGQCPAIVTKSADIEAAARDIAWIKFVNSGQICLSVNHVFVHPDVEKQLLERLTFYFNKYFKEGEEGMTRIVNQRNYDRLKGLLEKTDGRVETDAALSNEKRQIPPSVVSNVNMKDTLLSEELFGSICPVMTSATQDAIDSINSLPAPLGLYIFGHDHTEIDHIISSTQSGGVTVNLVALHAAIPGAPFGGVGESGHGYYHGQWGFKEFSHMRTIARPRPLISKLSALAHPPYSMDGLKWLRVKNGLGFKREWTLEDERRVSSRGKLLKISSRAINVLVVLVSLGLLDYKSNQRLGLLRRALGAVEYARTWFG
ncbi:aldehyde dehydrogenase [Aspergillus steynii IBT 23096]|uniref:Aldehyde dehydrogenase n=1 Tax=Aspergillus steynii IBT 23096 TaxID=1392250 RepID=A0A2I2FU63_9EURO|nr:aldehyde dehydrogenase [Aspergillus steynii IBT 23096]PLB44127.1 aldehyde dehydrogenase [Aspergillus steynii IBT 23096]